MHQDWYWATAAKIQFQSDPKQDEEADVVVIGAGYTGLSSALHCAQSGLKTIVLEGEKPGYGASGRNAGQWLAGWVEKTPNDILQIFGKDEGEKVNRLLVSGIKLIQKLVEGRESDLDFRNCGVLTVSRKQRQLSKLYDLAAQWAAYGLEIETLDHNSVRDFISSDKYLGGIRFCDAGILNPFAYSTHLAELAVSAGADIRCDSPVSHMNRESGEWSVYTSKGTVRAAKVIIATNAYVSSKLWPGLEQSFYQFQLPMMVSSPLHDGGKSFLPRGTPFAEMTIAGIFGGMLTADGRWLVSTMPPARSNAGINTVARWCSSRFRQTFPEAEQPRWDKIWWGNLAITANQLPKLVKLDDNVYTAFGYSGAGIVMATALGRELAKIMIENNPAASDFPVTHLEKVALPRFIPRAARQFLIPAMRGVDNVFT